MNNNYTMEDIEKFLVDYRNVQGVKPKDAMISIPLIGNKIYEKAFLENKKRDFFEQKYQLALNGSPEEQQEFIEKMSPILDDFYGVEKGRTK